jgi:DNA-binding transcriptional MerR regulator
MKIGEFAANHDITIDTIRHYMDLGLLVPEKVGGQYLFEESASKDLQNIIELKELGFSLGQIQEIIMHERAGRFRFLSEWKYYHNFFIEKKQAIKKEIELFLRQLDKLDKKLKDIEDLKPADEYPTGVPINFLNHACCPKCKGRLSMSKASIEDNMIINGTLQCLCGFNIKIIDGIIVIVDKGHSEDTSGMEVFFNEYFKNTDNQYLSLLYKGMEWIIKRLGFEKANNEIIILQRRKCYFL